MHRVVPAVRDALDETWSYLVRKTGSLDLADRQVDAIVERFHLLGRFPLLGRARDELRPGLRRHAVGCTVIIDRVAGPDVLILHGSRDIRRIFRDRGQAARPPHP